MTLVIAWKYIISEGTICIRAARREYRLLIFIIYTLALYHFWILSVDVYYLQKSPGADKAKR